MQVRDSILDMAGDFARGIFRWGGTSMTAEHFAAVFLVVAVAWPWIVWFFVLRWTHRTFRALAEKEAAAREKEDNELLDLLDGATEDPYARRMAYIALRTARRNQFTEAQLHGVYFSVALILGPVVAWRLSSWSLAQLG